MGRTAAVRARQDRGRAADHAEAAAARGRHGIGFQVGIAGIHGNGGGQGSAEGGLRIAGVCRGVADVAIQRDRQCRRYCCFRAPGKVLSSTSWEATC